MPFSRIIISVFVPAIIAGVIGWFIPGTILGSDSNDAFVFACIPVIIFYYNIWRRATHLKRKRLATLYILFGVSIIFWNIYNQNSTALTIWADSYTKRAVPSGCRRNIEALWLPSNREHQTTKCAQAG